jgi:hypothetical protein
VPEADIATSNAIFKCDLLTPIAIVNQIKTTTIHSPLTTPNFVPRGITVTQSARLMIVAINKPMRKCVP